MRYLALLAQVVFASCGGEAADLDASSVAADAVFAPLECANEFGAAHVFDSLEVLPEGQGVDITDDGTPDNQMGVLRPLVAAFLDEAFERGSFIFLTELTDWEGPDSSGDPQVSVAGYIGYDADSPPIAENNYGGEGEFLVGSRQFDVNCNPDARTGDARIEDGVLHATPENWRLQIWDVGTFVFAELRFSIEFSAHYRDGAGTAGGAWLPCDLLHVTGPAFAGDALLDVIVNQFARPEPDIDRDGDGLERFVGDGADVVECIDGDGTSLPGADCACDPRIVDGYSVSIAYTVVPAAIVGILQID